MRLKSLKSLTLTIPDQSFQRSFFLMEKSHKAALLAATQESDGSWVIDTSFCSHVGKKKMQILSSATAAFRKHPIPERDDSVNLFAAVLAHTILDRNLVLDCTEYQKHNIQTNWRELADSYIQTLCPQTVLPNWVAKAEELLDGHALAKKTQLCSVCKTPRPAAIRACATCRNIKNEQYLRQTRQTKTYEIDLSNPSLKKASIDHIDWSTVKGCHWIAGGLGSEGIIVTELNSGVLVFKCAGNDVKSEYMGYKIATLLGLNVPKMRIVAKDSPEGLACLNALKNAPFTNSEVNQRVDKYENYAHFLVMDFVASDSTFIAPKEVAVNWFAHPDFIPDVCSILACDILMNNYDRIPTVWKNEGNPGNILIKEENGKPRVISIDQIAVFISDSFLDNYLDSIRTFIAVCKQTNSVQSLPGDVRSAFAPFCQFFMDNMQIQMKDEHLFQCSMGICSSLTTMATKIQNTTCEGLFAGEEEHIVDMFKDGKLFAVISQIGASCLNELLNAS